MTDIILYEDIQVAQCHDCKNNIRNSERFGNGVKSSGILMNDGTILISRETNLFRIFIIVVQLLLKRRNYHEKKALPNNVIRLVAFDPSAVLLRCDNGRSRSSGF